MAANDQPVNYPNWTELPLTHPTPFTMILLYCSPMDVLSCRGTCSTWHSWFSSSSTIWSKYFSSLCSSMPNVVSYRMGKLTEVPAKEESSALTLSIKLHRALDETSPPINQETMGLVKTMEKLVPVLGPPSIFVKLKVDHPMVAKIVGDNLSRYLGCVLVDKKDVETREEVRRLVFRSMHRHNFAYVDFGQQRPEVTDVDTSDSLVLVGEDRLEEALRISMGGRGDELSGLLGEKRKRFSDKFEDSKRLKLDGEAVEESDAEQEEDDVDDSPDDPKSIYDPGETTRSEFPTILELLSIDQPVVQDLLVDKCQIDSSLVVPQFDEFLHHPSLLASSKLLVGCDSDGKVASVRPDTFSQHGGEVLGYIETPNVMFGRQNQQIQFWGGKDIRDKWPEFSKQLERMDKKKAANTSQDRPKGSKLNLPVAVATTNTAVSPGQVEAGSSSSSTNVNDLMAFLAARGVSVQKK